jgi:hypothetical protein
MRQCSVNQYRCDGRRSWVNLPNLPSRWRSVAAVAWRGGVAVRGVVGGVGGGGTMRKPPPKGRSHNNRPSPNCGEPHVICLSDFEGIDEPSGDWWMSCLLSCDPCNYQVCDLRQTDVLESFSLIRNSSLTYPKASDEMNWIKLANTEAEPALHPAARVCHHAF